MKTIHAEPLLGTPIYRDTQHSPITNPETQIAARTSCIMIMLDIIYPLAMTTIMETYGSYLPSCIRMDSSELLMEAVIDIRGYGIPMMQQI